MSQQIIVIGPPKAGKTFLLHHLTRSYFEPFRTDAPYQPTIGVDIVGINQKDNIKYIYYDSSGHDRFLELTKPYFVKADVVLIAFDLSRQDFQDLQKWYDWCNGCKKPTIIVGTKHDMVGEGSEQMLMGCVKFAQERECPFYPTSSVSGMGITELRNALQDLVPAEEIFERARQQREEEEKSKKKKKKKIRKRIKKLFCCIVNQYTTIDDQDEPSMTQTKYPVSDLDLGVSV
jgi:small GTP-binding protein